MSNRHYRSRLKSSSIFALVASILLASLYLTNSHILGSGTHSTTAPASPTQSPQVAKEYIYAGGRLIATEEPSSSSCSFSITPSSQNFPAGGGLNGVAVSSQTGCNWTASSNVPWVAIVSGSNGTGNGSVLYSVAINTGAARNGTLTIAGQTFTVIQAASSGSCSYSISPTSESFAASGGTNSVAVTAGTGCNWTASSNNTWITITAGSSGSGNGTVFYSVASNTGSARNGTMTIAGQTFTVSQSAGSSCSYSISPTSHSVGSGGSSNGVSVSAGTGCNWTASSNVSWLTINSGSSGSGNGTVSYSVAANTGAARNGTLTIAGLTFTVFQAAGSGICSYSISPTSESFAASGGTNSVAVTAGTGCNWTASSNNTWITITAGSSGSGNGTVFYSVASNTGSARNGTMTIAGQTFTVSQSAGGGGSTAHSLSLNGLSQYVIVPNSSTVNITGSITIEAWIKTNDATKKQTIISRYRPEVTSGFEGGYKLRITNTGKVVFATYKNASNSVEVTSTASVTQGVWTHVAGVFDGSTLRVFVNGTQSVIAVSNFNPRNGTSDLYIGMNPDGIQKVDGLLDEVRVTAAAVYSTNFTPQASLSVVTGTAGLWNFDSQTAADTSGNNNNGTLIGNPTFSTDVPGGGGAMNMEGRNDEEIAAKAEERNRDLSLGDKVWIWLGLGYRVMRASSLFA